MQGLGYSSWSTLKWQATRRIYLGLWLAWLWRRFAPLRRELSEVNAYMDRQYPREGRGVRRRVSSVLGTRRPGVDF